MTLSALPFVTAVERREQRGYGDLGSSEVYSHNPVPHYRSHEIFIDEIP